MLESTVLHAEMLTVTQAEETALMAKLTLHSVYGRFRADMFLSSLTESSSYPS